MKPKILSIAKERLEGSTFSPKQRTTRIARTYVDSLKSNNKQKRLIREITYVTDLINYEYNHSLLKNDIIEEITINPVSPRKKIILIANGRCDFTNMNFYKYINILNKYLKKVKNLINGLK